MLKLIICYSGYKFDQEREENVEKNLNSFLLDNKLYHTLTGLIFLCEWRIIYDGHLSMMTLFCFYFILFFFNTILLLHKDILEEF